MDITEKLTPSQMMVAQLAANGLSNEEIAAVADILPGTVKVHLRSIFKRLDIARRHEILRFIPPQRVYRPKGKVSEEDRELLDLIVGNTDAEIAARTNLHSTAVSARVRQLRLALGFASRNELAMWWMVETGDVEQSAERLPSGQRAIIKARETVEEMAE